MKIQNLFYILVAAFIICSMIFQAFSSSSTGKRSTKLKIASKTSWILAILCILPIVFRESISNHILTRETEIWEKYQIPPIDSSMSHDNLGRHISRYYSTSKDSILFYSRITRFDLFDIYKIEDVYLNRKLKLSLNATFIKPNLLRDSSQAYSLQNMDSPFINSGLEINKHSFDSTLIQWGLYEDYMKRR
jgi:hypothetical protein